MLENNAEAIEDNLHKVGSFHCNNVRPDPMRILQSHVLAEHVSDCTDWSSLTETPCIVMFSGLCSIAREKSFQSLHKFHVFDTMPKEMNEKFMCGIRFFRGKKPGFYKGTLPDYATELAFRMTKLLFRRIHQKCIIH
jgi:hypothetical protein